MKKVKQCIIIMLCCWMGSTSAFITPSRSLVDITSSNALVGASRRSQGICKAITTTSKGINQGSQPRQQQGEQQSEPQSITPPKYPVPQVVAPAGGQPQFMAALNSGADQVFLGLRIFNARARAENFSIKDLQELVPLAHKYGMQVLVTVNVLIKEAELEALIDVLGDLEALEVDAIIVQDQAVGQIAKDFFPTLRLHASTQMAVRSLAGVIKASAMGYRRVVLARELTAKEMKDTRGECANTCRSPYEIKNEKGMGFLFSMMDLDTSHSLDLLTDAGIDTLKIEGRKKDAQYVASSVQLYRNRLDQLYGRNTIRPEAPAEAKRSEEELRKDLSLSFHRGTTSFFVKGRYHENVIDLENAGHLGVQCGRVHSVTGDGKSFRVYTEVPLERYDGLKVVPPSRAFHSTPQHGPGAAAATTTNKNAAASSTTKNAAGGKKNAAAADTTKKNDARSSTTSTTTEGASMSRLQDKFENELPEFSLRKFKVNGQKAFEALSGAYVDVEVPMEVRRSWTQGEARPIKVGDVVFKTRSNELKRRVEAFAVVREAYKLKEWSKIDVQIDVIVKEEEKQLHVNVGVSKLGQELLCDELILRLEWAKAKSAEAVASDLAEVLGTYGDRSLRAETIWITGLPLMTEEKKEEQSSPAKVPFIPRKDLKAMKQRIASKLNGLYDEFLYKRKATAYRALGIDTYQQPEEQQDVPLSPVAWEDRKFIIKIDRPEYLNVLEAYMREVLVPKGVDGLIEGVVFEPKRAYIPEVKPLEGVTSLLDFGERTGVDVRLALPTVIRAWDEAPLKGWTQAWSEQPLKRNQVARYEVGNLGGWQLLEEWGLLGEGKGEVATDFFLYALNSQASVVWAKEGASKIALSVEDDEKDLRNHMNHWTRAVGRSWPDSKPQYILYKDTPLFLAEACSLTALHGGCPGFKVCGYRTLEIENGAGESYMVAHEHCKSIVYSKDAQSTIHHQKVLLDMGIADFRLDFLTRHYDEKHLRKVLDSALLRSKDDYRPLPNTHTANFDRTLL